VAHGQQRALRRRRGRGRRLPGERRGVLDGGAAGQPHHDGDERGARAGEGQAREPARPGSRDAAGACAAVLDALAQLERRLHLRGRRADHPDGALLVGEHGRELGVLGHAGLQRGALRAAQRPVGQRGQLPQHAIVVWLREAHVPPLLQSDGMATVRIPGRAG
jgi:hypothetical protein